MAAGAGYIEFTTGDILTASAANEYLASQVVMVFASASARTSAIASPQEGMMSYLKDTNSVEYYSGAAWVAVGGSSSSSGLTLITSASLTGSAVSVNNCFSSTYNNYKIVTAGMIGSTGGDDLFFNLRASGSDSTSNYNRFIWGSANYEASTGQSNLRIGLINSTQAFLETTVSNPFASAPTALNFAANRTSSSAWLGIGYHSNATSYDGFTLAPTGGSFSGGTVYVYGYNK